MSTGNNKFEIEYILSLTILMLTFLTVDSLKIYLDFKIAVIFLFLVAIYIILYNLANTFKKASKFELTAINKIEKVSQVSIMVILLDFIYVIVHIFLNIILKGVFVIEKILINDVDMIYIISLSFPLIFVVILMIPLYKKIIKPILLFKNVDIVTSPNGTRIYKKYDDSEPLYLRIENTSRESLPFDVNIDFPENVYYKNKEEDLNKYHERITLNSRNSKSYNLYMKYNGNIKKADQINIIVSSGAKKYKKDIHIIMESI